MRQRHSDTHGAASPGPPFPEDEEEKDRASPLVAGTQGRALSPVCWGRGHMPGQALGRDKHCAFAFQMRIAQAGLRGKT